MTSRAAKAKRNKKGARTKPTKSNSRRLRTALRYVAEGLRVARVHEVAKRGGGDE
jgi:hypothetical protein